MKRRCAIVLTLILGLSLGCNQGFLGLGARRPVAPRAGGLERIRSDNPDLAQATLTPIATFESSREIARFRLVQRDDPERRGRGDLSLTRGRGEATGSALAAPLTGEGATLLLDLGQSDPPLPTDWRPHALLLMNLSAEPGDTQIELSLRSGGELPLIWTRRLTLAPGWNTVRVDLAEAGRQLDLANMQAVTWTLLAGGPATLTIDGVVLANNTRWICGQSPDEGALYAFERGRRLHVGAHGRFEIAFAEALITEWRQAGGENLAVPDGLGPWPAPLSPGWDERPAGGVGERAPPALWGSVQAEQRLVETSPVRIVVEGRWRVSDAGQTVRPDSGAAERSHAWRYAIYPQGLIFIRTTATAGQSGWPTPLLGFGLAVDQRRPFELIKPRRGSASTAATRFVLLTRRGRGEADLLWVAHDPNALQLVSQHVAGDPRQLRVVAGQLASAETIDVAHLLRLWPGDMNDATGADAFATGYLSPAPLRCYAGSIVRDAPGDLDGDGFNESEGCYETRLEAGTLRLTLDPRGGPRDRPVFRVRGAAGQRCWVYCDGQSVASTGRDAADELLVVVPRTIHRPMQLEVHTRPGARESH